MDAIQPRLARRRYPAQTRPISRVEMQINGGDAYERGIAESVAWIVRHAGTRIDTSAFKGAPFSTGPDARAPVEAQTLLLDGRNHWFFRLHDPDEDVAARRWDAGGVIRQEDEGATVLISLDVLLGGGDLQALKRQLTFRRTIPGLVRQMTDALACRVGGDSLSSSANLIDSREAFDEFLAYIFGNERTLPAIVFSQARGRDGELAGTAQDYARRLAGIGRCFVLAEDCAWYLTEAVGSRWSVFNGAVRIYRPALQTDGENAPFDHPIFFRSRAHELSDYIDNMIKMTTTVAQSLPFAKFLFHEFQHDLLIRRAPLDRASNSDAVPEQVQLLEGKIAEMSSDIEGYEGLLMDAQKYENYADNRIRQLSDEKEDLVEKLNHLGEELSFAEGQLKEQNVLSQRYLTRFDIEDEDQFKRWAEAVLHPHVQFSDNALNDLDEFKNISLDDGYLPRLSQAFFAIRDVIQGANPNALGDHYRGWQIEVARCFSNRNDIKNYSGYDIPVDGSLQKMDWHAKWGRDGDIRSSFRIYFYWDEDARVAHVGHFPSHLNNKLTKRR